MLRSELIQHPVYGLVMYWSFVGCGVPALKKNVRDSKGSMHVYLQSVQTYHIWLLIFDRVSFN